MSGIKRAHDWRARLSSVVEGRRRVRYSETNPCALFLADCVAAMTGVDLAKAYRGRFKTLEEGFALLRAAGYRDLCEFMSEHFEEIPPAMACAGDIMVFESEPTGWAGGIVNGERVTVMAMSGLGTVSRDDGKRAFKVP